MTEGLNERVISFIKESQYTPIELFFNELISSNVYIGEDADKNKAFMIKIPSNELNCNLIDNIDKVSKVNCSSLLKFISLSFINNEYYLIYEFCNGIRFNDYIKNAAPKALKRMHVLKQLVNILTVLYKNQIQLFPLKDKFIFIDSLEDLNVKMLYANWIITNKSCEKNHDNEHEGGGIVGKETNEQHPFDSKEYFSCVASFVYTITKYNMKSDVENFNLFFNEFDEETSSKIKIFFTKIQSKSQLNNTDQYSFDDLIKDSKKLFNGLGLIEGKDNNNYIPSISISIPSNSNPPIATPSSSTVEPPKLNRPSFDKKPILGSSTSGLLFSTTTSTNPNPNNNNVSGGVKFQNTIVKDVKGEDSNKKKIKPSTKKGSNVPDNIIKIPLKEETKQNVTEGTNANCSIHNQNNNTSSMNPSLNQGSNDYLKQNFLNSIHELIMRNFQLNQMRIPNQMAINSSEYRIWLQQSLMKMNGLDQIVKMQLMQIDNLWGNIQYSHNQFSNHISLQGGTNINNGNTSNKSNQ